MEQRINVITLGVADLRRARDFYEALGWQRTGASDGTVSFRAGDLTIELRARGGRDGVTLGHLVESLIDVELVLAEARGAGATITQPASSDLQGGYDGVFVDPDGHAWRIVRPEDGP
jgi:catechol 2,3-dioxygenase-like lactoylglutathione lyase family enzyme